LELLFWSAIFKIDCRVDEEQRSIENRMSGSPKIYRQEVELSGKNQKIGSLNQYNYNKQQIIGSREFSK
jgi:hypothetical protein